MTSVLVPQALLAPPDVPCERGIFLSNLWYQHQQILVRHAGLPESLVALPGKLQNGWQPGTGLDGEQGMKEEVRLARLPFYLWSDRAQANAMAEGFDWGATIGAPFVYGGFAAGNQPAIPTLLAFPTHSVDPDYPVAGWADYAADLLAFARSEGFERATACLYWRDYDLCPYRVIRFVGGTAVRLRSASLVECREEGVIPVSQIAAGQTIKFASTDRLVAEALLADSSGCPRAVLEAKGIETTTLGDPFSAGFLDRFAALARDATAVTSERVCSAGMYALWLHRPFVVRGRPLAATHPELDIGPAGDPIYLRHEFPELLRLDGQVHRDTAARELGADHMRSPDALRDLIFGGAP